MHWGRANKVMTGSQATAALSNEGNEIHSDCTVCKPLAKLHVPSLPSRMTGCMYLMQHVWWDGGKREPWFLFLGTYMATSALPSAHVPPERKPMMQMHCESPNPRALF